MQAGECGQHDCRQTQANKMQAERHRAARPKSGIYQPPITTRSVNTLSPASFLIQRTKSPVCSRFTPGASGARPLSYISHLTGRHFAGHYRHLASSCFAGISISLPAVLPPATLFLKALPALHQPQLPSSAFRNPKMHPHQQAFHQYQAPRH